MLIRLKKLSSGVVLTCLRDGHEPAVQRSGHGGFFALHDLMHYAVETTLGLSRAFWGLMAEGWSFETFEDKADPRYQALPEEALLAEHLVDLLSREFGPGAWRDANLLTAWAQDVNAEIATRMPGVARRFAAAELVTIMTAFEGLGARWAEIPEGEHLELTFPPEPSVG
ncbi:MAG: hypothetical protein H6811_05915 [Phycisphaeraceae bacterium]|nr:hypothetical protein [Phycisphaeraceae bacterium]